MIVYFVRHGESEGNAKNIHQCLETELSDIGFSQANHVARRFKNIPIDVILSSDYVRTLQTASSINSVIRKEIIPTPLLREYRRPSEVVGKNILDPIVVDIIKTQKNHRDENDWHFSDEENTFDFLRRARLCLDYIGSRSESKVLCVTHGLMLCALLSIVVFGDNLTPLLFEKIYQSFHSQNTGITIFKYEEDTWKLITWNDRDHLGAL
jgi:probable phosphoglycerate mutase/uncharacterized phosphatase